MKMSPNSTLAGVLVSLLILLPTNGEAATVPVVADAPIDVPSESAFRPAYFTELGEVREQLKAQEAAILQHTIKRGETLSTIAKKYGLSVKSLVQTNNLSNPNFVYEGQVLTLITNAEAAKNYTAPVIHRLQRGETIWELAKRYQTDVDDILAANNIDNAKKLEPGLTLTIPGAAMPVSQTPNRLIASRSTAQATNTGFVWPTKGYISSGYGPRWGKFHYGLDIAANTGTPLVAIAAGRITDSGWRQGYGYMVRIDHQNGWVSVYGHCSKLYVKGGQQVRRGQQIAAIGQTGNATGPHVHLEMLKKGKHHNPINYLPAR
ncbi:MAG TPA: M23 family metallopeptidase [Oscillospiraceae bacterium]|nr:M23 family metallopeptidase [Oscillospiraceae bacterium]